MKDDSFLGIERPLTSVWVAAVLLNCDEHHVHAFIEDGTLPLAFNIAQPGARRAAIRIALPNIVELRNNHKRSDSLDGFLTQSLTKGIYRAAEVAWLMQCDYDFIYKLVRLKALDNVSRKGHYLIPRQSLHAFLKTRQII